MEAGLLADSVATFKPQQPLTQRALAAALETLSLSSEEVTDYSYPAVVPGRAVTIRELDAALVSTKSSASATSCGITPRPFTQA